MKLINMIDKLDKTIYELLEIKTILEKARDAHDRNSNDDLNNAHILKINELQKRIKLLSYFLITTSIALILVSIAPFLLK